MQRSRVIMVSAMAVFLVVLFFGLRYVMSSPQESKATILQDAAVPDPAQTLSETEPLKSSVASQLKADVRGIVYNEESGVGYGGVRMQACLWDGWNSDIRYDERDMNLALETITDDLGRFAFDGLVPGSYIIKRGEVPRSPSEEWWEHVRVVLSAGEVAGEIVYRIREGKAASGQVVDAQGNGVAGATVTQEFSGRECKADGNGFFKLDGIAVGDHLFLKAFARGYGLGGLYGRRLRMPMDGISELEIILYPSRSIDGIVTRVSGEGIGGISVALPGSPPTPSAVTDENGRFEIVGISRENEEISLRLYSLSEDLKVVSGNGPYRFGPNDHISGATLVADAMSPLEAIRGDGHDLHIPPKPSDSPKQTTGFVLDNAGSPIPGAVVNGVSIDDAGDVALTDKDGGFAMKLGATGTCRIWVRAKGYRFASLEDVLCGSERNELIVTPGVYVRGVVLDAESRTPITKFRAGIASLNSTTPGLNALGTDMVDPRQLICDNAGAFEIPTLEDGVVRLFVGAEDFATQFQDVEVGADGVTFLLERGLTLEGMATTMQGAPARGVCVEAYIGGIEDSRPKRDRMLGLTLSDHEGQFRLTGLERQIHLLRFVSSQYVRHEQEFDLSQSQRFEVQLVEVGAIEGIVTIGNELIIGAHVSARIASEEDRWFNGDGYADTNPRGVYRIDGLMPGTFKVDCTLGDEGEIAEREVVEVKVISGEATTANFDF